MHLHRALIGSTGPAWLVLTLALTAGCGDPGASSSTLASPVPTSYLTQEPPPIATSAPPSPPPAPPANTVTGTDATSPTDDTTAGSAPTDGSSVPGTGLTHQIAGGDDLYGISQQYCVTLDELVAANGWTDGYEHLILPGDVIQIPGDGC